MASHNRFILFILKDTLKDDKISLPTKTVRKFGAKIPNRVVFKLPDNAEWEIAVIKSEKMVWFDRGWREFTEYYGLDYGSLLTFKFDGESAFKVCIFDKTATEIDYRCAAQKTSKNSEFKGRDSIKLERDLLKLEGDLLVQIRRKRSLPDPRPLKKVKTEDEYPCTGVGPTEFRDTHIVSEDEEGEHQLSAEVIPISKRTKSIPATKKIQAPERTRSFKSAAVALREGNPSCHGSARDRASEFTSRNPFFVASVYQSHVTGCCCLFLPSSFIRTQLKGVDMEHLQDIVLQTSDGKQCSAKLHLNKRNQNFQVRIGWHRFIHDNKLKKGDVCAFELILDFPITFIVHIYRASNSVRENSRHRRGGPKSRKIPRKHVSQHPYFQLCIGTSSILQASLHLPAKFVNEHLSHNEIEKVTLRVGDERWAVKLKRYPTAVKFSGGWRSFARDNALRVGDVCIFELGDNFEFQVSILRSS